MMTEICVFDAYGTLFDVAGAARLAAAESGGERLGAVWPRLAEDWRRKQLEYTWLRAITGDHTSFWQVTVDGLDWALENADLDDPALRDRLLALYRELPAYPEVPAMLRALRDAGQRTAILSNGDAEMLAAATQSAGLTGLLDAVLTVEAVGVFKPASAVYDQVGTRFGVAADRVLFVSSNGWDVAGAAGYGFRTVWVNRSGAPQDRLSAAPAHVLTDLSQIPELV